MDGGCSRTEWDSVITELMGREPIRLDDRDVCSMIRDRVCMVTGAGGSIGSELCRQIAGYHPEKLVLVDIYENGVYEIQQELLRRFESSLCLDVRIVSVQDQKEMENLFEQTRPDVVFHAAAHKHVPLMEKNPKEAVKNNIFGTYYTAVLAKKYQAKRFVLISTDKAVHPISIMGQTKRCCELMMQCLSKESVDTQFVTVRFGNVIGSNGSVVPLFCRQIEEGGPVTVTHPDMVRYFMTIPEAASLVLQAGAMAKGGETFILNMGKPIKIAALAEQLIRFYGKIPGKDIRICYTGIRPGDKLSEELLTDSSRAYSTENRKIYVEKAHSFDQSCFKTLLHELKKTVEQGDEDKIVKLLGKIVTESDRVMAE